MPRVRAFGLVRGAVPPFVCPLICAHCFVPTVLYPPGGLRRGELLCGVGLRFCAGLYRLLGIICRSLPSHAGVSAPAAVIKDALCHMPGKSVHLRCVILSSGVNSGSLER